MLVKEAPNRLIQTKGLQNHEGIMACLQDAWKTIAGMNLGLHPANERQRYFVTMSLIGWVQA